MKRKLVVAAVLIAVLLGLFLYFFCNGLVLIDGKPALRVRLDFAENGDGILVPVVATLCEVGYEKISEEDGIIQLQKNDQTITIDLNALTFSCPQVPFDCFRPMPGNNNFYCLRKGNEVMMDSENFGATLTWIDSNHVVSLDDPRYKVLKLSYYEIDPAAVETIFDYAYEQEEERPDVITNGRLVVNGVDITEGNYVRINHGKEIAEIPMLAILRALGHDAEIQYNEARDIYESVIDNEVGYYSTKEEDFSVVLLHHQGCVRKIVNNDFIIDSTCAEPTMYRTWEATITVDYDTSTVYVDSCDPWA